MTRRLPPFLSCTDVLHVVPLAVHAHIHAHATHRTCRPDAHVLLSVQYEAAHWLTLRTVRRSLTHCSIGLVDHGLDYPSSGINKPVVDL